jgi:hypothetical protein
MTQQETITHNIGLTFDFVNYLLDNKSDLEKLPDNFELEFQEKDFSKLEYNQDIPFIAPKREKKYVRVRNAFEFA